MEIITSSFIIFCIAQIFNVIVSTLKVVLTVKASAWVAAFANSVSYTINAVVTYLLVSQDPMIIIVVTFASNFIGVPLGRMLIDKFEKEKLWVYNATVRITEDRAAGLRSTLKEYFDIHSTFEEISYDELYSMKFFAYNKEASKVIKDTLDRYNAKYYIVEPR